MKNRTKIGIIYFVVHFCVEMICFATVRRIYPLMVAGLIAFGYNFFAFVPQWIFGEIITRFKRLPMGAIGVTAMGAGMFLTLVDVPFVQIPGVFILALGNAVLHECGAIATVSHGDGRIFPAALFVSGGSFGLVIGQTMGVRGASLLWQLIPLAIIVWMLYLDRRMGKTETYPVYNVVNLKGSNNPSKGVAFSAIGIILIAFFVTLTRSFLGYAIPISWKKELWQDFLLFFIMGFGKAMGGWLVDKFGARKVGVLSTILSVPFLIFGNNLIVVSVIGVCMFSMTMCITFAMILSVLPKNPGISFGITTIALFIGIVIPLFVHFNNVINAILIIVCSIICGILLFLSCNNKRPGKYE